jgi:hypothetical protein
LAVESERSLPEIFLASSKELQDFGTFSPSFNKNQKHRHHGVSRSSFFIAIFIICIITDSTSRLQ